MKTEIKPTTEFESSHPLARRSPFHYLPLLILAVLLLNLFNSCNNSRRLNLAIQNKPYIYVQTTDGEIVKAKPVDPLHREEVVIANFGENWLKIAFTWNNTRNQAQSTTKTYVQERGTNYPYQFHLASLAIQPGYREAFMTATQKKYRQDFVFSKYISGEYQSYVRTFEQPIVTKVRNDDGDIMNGVWDVKIVATRTHAADTSIIGHEIFNKIIRLRAVEPSDEQGLWSEEPNSLGKLLNQMQKKGLQVVSVTEF